MGVREDSVAREIGRNAMKAGMKVRFIPGSLFIEEDLSSAQNENDIEYRNSQG